MLPAPSTAIDSAVSALPPPRDVENGKVDGNTLTWSMNMTVPMPMKLEGTATVDGDTLDGSVNAGAFGSMAMTGTRQG